MIFDLQSLFSDAQAITGDAVSTNVMDFLANGTPFGSDSALPKDYAGDYHLPLLVQVVETFDAMTSLAIGLEVDDDIAFGSSKIIPLGTLLLADAVAGKMLPFRIMPHEIDARYGRMDYNVTGSNPTVGKITAGIVAAIQTNS